MNHAPLANSARIRRSGRCSWVPRIDGNFDSPSHDCPVCQASIRIDKADGNNTGPVTPSTSAFEPPMKHSGRTMRSLVPQHEQTWFDIYGRVATTRQPERFEQHAAALGRHYEVYACPYFPTSGKWGQSPGGVAR